MRPSRAIPIKHRLLVSMLLTALVVTMTLCLSSAPALPGPSSQSTLEWFKLSDGGFGDSRNIGCLGMSVKDGRLYFGTWATTIGASVIRYDGSGFIKLASDGFGTLLNYATGTVLHDDTIYAGTFYPLVGCEVWRHDGGTSWTKVAEGGFGNPANYGTFGAASHDGSLYVGTENRFSGGEVWRYDGGASWTRVDGGTSPGNGGFGDANNAGIHLMTFNGSLYASTMNMRTGLNPATGLEVWRYDGGTTWTRVDGGTSPGNGGFGDANNRKAGLVVYGGALYAGTQNEATGGEAWRYDGGTTWTRVDGGTSPGNGGFGDPNNTDLYSVAVCDGRLYAGTENDEGCEVWRYDGGTTWTKVADGGFGNPDNFAVRWMADWQGSLVIATGNLTTGTEVWTAKTVPETVVKVGAPVWYLAEGATEGGFESWVLVQNPGHDPVLVDFTLNTGGGAVAPPELQGVEIGAGRRRTFNIGEYVTTYDVSTVVAARNGDIICERAMYWTPPGSATRVLGHDSIGVTSPARTWYLAEGATEGGFESWVLVQNPGPDPVLVDFTLNTGGGAVAPPELQGVEVGAGRRRTFNIGEYVTTYDVSTVVAARDGDIICERAMYWTPPGSAARVLGHDSVGVTEPISTWYLAEGATEGGFESWVLVQNPGPDPVLVDFTLNTGGGAVAPPELQGVEIGAGRRRTFNIGEYVTTYDVSTVVAARNGDIICERAMYWTPPGSAARVLGHDSVGTSRPAMIWCLAEGATEGGFESWVLVQNPGPDPALVDFTLNTGGGAVAPPELQGVEIGAGRRRTFNIGEYVTTYDVSTVVEARGGLVICERAMYWTPPGYGTRVLGHDSLGYPAGFRP